MVSYRHFRAGHFQMSYSECSAGSTVGRERSEARQLWGIIGAMAIIVVVSLVRTGLRVHVGFPIIAGFALLVGLNLFYTNVRKRPLFASITLTCAQLVAFTNLAIIMSYLACAQRFPLVDDRFAAMDAAIGFDWPAAFTWAKVEHPAIGSTLDIIYDTMIAQFFVLLVALCVTRKTAQLRRFAWLFAVTLLIIIPISMALPAEGAWAHYGVARLTSAYYLPDFYALRSGAMHTIDLRSPNGIIQFPSFHASLGLILILCSRGTFLFWFFLPLNVVMIASAMTAGGHYLVDIVFGLATVPFAIVALRMTHLEAEKRP
ncbi:hypothetical protein CK489_28750 [Bradyrhizobium sp. UFLA03-84]|uniref:phosphatase PAP2 family protein n=1 Tax=Bradyrhizobium sp. UFLA03-84 TaxID=418599 RepID=UPI000BAE3E10|nr:phosphatase PAP2 family protein [Bradyrhizobium sp. UFLA03-84]PAY05382.1 hypothetical protein CK489_28750 [Bradyrhizobium sp. UFLA03-84]